MHAHNRHFCLVKTKQGDDVTFPARARRALYKQLKAGAPQDLYECQSVPGYEVGQGFELAPSPTCLSGGYAWGVCEDGRFLCQIMRPNVWHGNESQRVSWKRTQKLLKASNRLPSLRPHPASHACACCLRPFWCPRPTLAPSLAPSLAQATQPLAGLLCVPVRHGQTCSSMFSHGKLQLAVCA
jgi:hypothetical protein